MDVGMRMVINYISTMLNSFLKEVGSFVGDWYACNESFQWQNLPILLSFVCKCNCFLLSEVATLF